MDAIDVALNVSSRATVMALLKSTTRPVSKLDYERSANPCGYTFTGGDIDEFLRIRRPDLAELVVAATGNVDLLYDVCDRPMPVSVLQAVCRNAAAPADLLVLLYCESRKGVVSAARSALANRMRVPASRADSPAALLRDLLLGPEEDVAGLLARFYRLEPDSAAEYATEAVLERPTPLPDEVWNLISAGNWCRVTRLGSSALTAKIARHPRMTVGDLKAIMSRVRHRSSAFDVADALLAKLEPGSDDWLTLMWDCSSRMHTRTVKEHAQYLTFEQALEMSRRGQTTPEGLAFASGKLPDEMFRKRVQRWLDDPSASVPPPVVLKSPAVAGELLDACVVRAKKQREAYVHLQCNPAFSEEAQLKWLTLELDCANLAASRHVARSTAELLVRQASKFAKDSTGSAYIPWSVRNAVVALFANDSVDADVRLGLPAQLLGSVVSTLHSTGSMPSASGYRSIRFLDEQLGCDAEAWKVFLGLLPEWEGTLGELVSAARVL